MKLAFCAVCGSTINLHQHHIEPIVFTRIKRKNRTIRFDGNKPLKECSFWEIFSYLFDIGVITEDAEITVCEYHHAIMHGMIKFQIMEGKKLAEEGRRKARERGVKFGRPTVCCSEVVERIISLRDSGMGIKKIADDCKVGIGTVYKAIKSKEINVTI